MRDTLILALTVLLAFLIMLGGQYLRGDYTVQTAQYAATQTQLNGLAREKNGLILLNVNLADAGMLDALDGIGPTLAERIVSYREEYGPFASLDDLLHVHGIGETTLNAIRDRITVE